MGEVYRARDTRLGREVAIKVLPDVFARDAERVVRFQREARVLAALNHPNIGAIYDIVEQGSARFLILELVGGENLAERIARGPMPPSEVIQAARQMAEALESAHEKGIVHRDLKPENIKINEDGDAKVLDFGLAKLRENSAGQDTSDAATSTGPTQIMGTAAYMSPEQAAGKDADHRSDIWAFGCLLYEMITGSKAFSGGSVSEILAEVLKTEPDLRRLPPDTPPALRRLIRRCLEKDRHRRLHDIADARIELDDAQREVSSGDSGPGGSVSRRTWLGWAAAAVFGAVNGGVLYRFLDRDRGVEPLRFFPISTPATIDPVSLAISPDGEKIAFVATWRSGSVLWLRRLGAPAAEPLPGTEGASYPFWSPDSQWVAFGADGKLTRIHVDRREPHSIAGNVSVFRGGTWNRDNVILFGTAAGPLFRASADTPAPARPVFEGSEHGSQRFPQFLPDGGHFIYYGTGTGNVSGVFVGSLDGKTERLIEAGPNDDNAVKTAAVYAPSAGQLLFVKQGKLWRQSFDDRTRKLEGEAAFVADSVTIDTLTYATAVSASERGHLVYRTGPPCGQRQFTWLDREGNRIRDVGGPNDRCPLNPTLSAGETEIVLSQRDASGTNVDIYSLNLRTGQFVRLTHGEGTDMYPIWSPAGSDLIFASTKEKGLFDLYKLSRPSGVEGPFLKLAPSLTAMDASSKTGYVLFRILNRDSWDLMAAKLTNGTLGEPVDVASEGFEERDGQFSPDGNWVAYQAIREDRSEIYVQRFPEASAPVLVSNNGGAQVRWNRNGKEIFYIDRDGMLVAVELEFDPAGEEVTVVRRDQLFATGIGGPLQGTYRQQYMVSNDGQRFLMSTLTDRQPEPIMLVSGWRP